MTTILPSSFNLADRDLRQRDLVPPEKLAACKVTVIGVGAIGRQVAIQLAAMGVVWLQFFDHDTVDVVNLAPQGYFPSDIGMPKVDATANLLRQINPDTQLHPVAERFRRSSEDHGNVVFVCVDSIDTRKLIFETLGQRVDFLCDGRMAAEVCRVLTVTDHASAQHYPATLFAGAEAFRGTCTAKSTLYCANIAAGLMVGQFAKCLRCQPTDRDLTLNLLAAELTPC
jgi:sulfur carrier protein ThiS adenylyltransferase